MLVILYRSTDPRAIWAVYDPSSQEVTLVKISKLEGDLCANFPRICTYVWLLWTPFVALNGSKNSGEIDTKYVSGAIYFWLRNKAWGHFDL